MTDCKKERRAAPKAEGNDSLHFLHFNLSGLNPTDNANNKKGKRTTMYSCQCCNNILRVKPSD